jgi:hypothetical protein
MTFGEFAEWLDRLEASRQSGAMLEDDWIEQIVANMDEEERTLMLRRLFREAADLRRQLAECQADSVRIVSPPPADEF